MHRQERGPERRCRASESAGRASSPGLLPSPALPAPHRPPSLPSLLPGPTCQRPLGHGHATASRLSLGAVSPAPPHSPSGLWGALGPLNHYAPFQSLPGVQATTRWVSFQDTCLSASEPSQEPSTCPPKGPRRRVQETRPPTAQLPTPQPSTLAFCGFSLFAVLASLRSK